MSKRPRSRAPRRSPKPPRVLSPKGKTLPVLSDAPTAPVEKTTQPASGALTLSTRDVIDLARRGDVEPLAACVLDGSATVAERKFVVDRFRRSFKSDLRPRGEAEKEARDRKIAARMLQRSGSKVVSVVAEEFGVKPRTVWAAKKKHGHKGLIKP